MILRSSLRELSAAFLSGFASLVFQIAWQRVVAQEVGVDLISTKVTVIVFLLGLAFGYRKGSSLARTPGVAFGRWFAGCELAIGITGLLSISALRAIRPLALSQFEYFDLLFAAVILLIPTFFMGLSTPMLVGASRQRTRGSGELVGRIYAANVLGAAIGAFASGLALIELLGLQTTCRLAAAANFGAAWIVIHLYSASTPTAAEVNRNRSPVWSQSKVPPNLILAAICLGMASLVFELLAFRTVFFFFGLASYQFPIVLGTFLLAMSLGEWTGGELSVSARRPFGLEPISILLWLTALSVCVAFLSTHLTPELAASGTIVKTQLIRLAVFLVLFLSPTVFISAFFPVLIGRLPDSGASVASQTAHLLFIFTISNAVGGLIASFLIFPWIGTAKALLLTVLLVATACGFLSPSRRILVHGVLATALSFAVYRDFIRTTQKGQIETIENHAGIFSVMPGNGREVDISLFRTPTASAFPKEGPDFLNQMNKWTMTDLGLSSNFKPRNALVIGLGNGMIAYDLAKMPSMQSVVVVELMPSVVDLVFKYSNSELRGVVWGPKVKILTGDGRRYLQKLPSTYYDVIQVAVFHPWTAGASNVYTEDFFRELSSRLSPTGVVALLSYYPLVDATAHRVFPYAYSVRGWNERFHYFSNHPIRIEDISPTKLQHCSWSSPNRVVSRFATLHPQQNRFSNTDDRPLLEYYFLRQSVRELTGFEFRAAQDLPSRSEPLIHGTLECVNDD